MPDAPPDEVWLDGVDLGASDGGALWDGVAAALDPDVVPWLGPEELDVWDGDELWAGAVSALDSEVVP